MEAVDRLYFYPNLDFLPHASYTAGGRMSSNSHPAAGAIPAYLATAPLLTYVDTLPLRRPLAAVLTHAGRGACDM